MAFAASTRLRRGLAVRVTRIRPRRNSAVMNMVATTSTAISPANVPTSVSATEPAVPPSPPGRSGAMSPDPVTVSVPPDWRYPPRRGWLPGIGSAPMLVPRHRLPGGTRCRATRAKAAGAWGDSPLALDPLADWLVTLEEPGDAANSPAWTVAASLGRVAMPTQVQCTPSA